MERLGPSAGRGQWRSRTGFILAAVGSAVGLGNIWRFPFVTAENGGAVFVLIYLAILLVLGIPALWAELVLGRKGGLNPVGTMQRLSRGPDGRAGRFWTMVGVFFVAFSIFVLAWYSVISGWVLRYLVHSFSGDALSDPGGFFTSVEEGPFTLLYHLIAVALTVGVIASGVAKGIERVVFVMMPVLFALIAGIAIWAAFLPDAGDGYAFYFRPELGAVTAGTFVAAAGQAFFSMSIGMGAILTYASYLSKRESLSADGAIVGLADTGVALAGGLMLFPLLASFGLLGFAVNEGGGPAAVFLAVPSALGALGGLAGGILSVVFFTALFFAAFSSSLSLLEVSVSWLLDRWGFPRAKAAILMGLVAYTAGIFTALSVDVFGWTSGGLTDVLVILGGLLIVVFAGWFVRDASRELDANARWRVSRVAMPLIRYVAPPALGALLVFAVLDLRSDAIAALGPSGRGAVDGALLGLALAVWLALLLVGGSWLRRDANRRGEAGNLWLGLFATLLVLGILGGLFILLWWAARRPERYLCDDAGLPLPERKKELAAFRPVLRAGARVACRDPRGG